MARRKPRILIVEPNPDLLEMLIAGFARRLDTHVTCVDDAVSALEVDMGHPHDLVIAEQRLPGMSGLRLTEQLSAFTGTIRPIVLLSDRPNGKKAIRALRAGVHDIFVKPFALSDLLDRADQLLAEYDLRRKQIAKYHRMRELVRRVIRERRDLNRRTELICRDLVGAHRRLVHRVLAFEKTKSGSTV